jgi:hypothetical protein
MPGPVAGRQLPECSKSAEPMMDRIPVRLAGLPSHLARCGIGRHALLTHQRGELLAPVAQRVLADVRGACQARTHART